MNNNITKKWRGNKISYNLHLKRIMLKQILKKLFKLLKKSFLKSYPFSKIINKNTVKHTVTVVQEMQQQLYCVKFKMS